MLKLIQGDSFEELKKIKTGTVDMIFADPPYFLSNDGITCKSGKMVSVNKGSWDRISDVDEKHKYNRKWIRLCKRVLKPNGTIWISGTLHNIYSIGMALEQEGLKMRNFDEWLGKFRASISGYDYYVDFNKVVRNVEEIKVELNILNSLIGSKDIEKDFENVVTRYPETLECIPLLLAVRGNEIYAQDEEGAYLYNFKQMNYSVEQYKVFMRKTGLFDLISNHLVNNLVDYALGVETGLDSNGRKNRGGHQMEDLVEKYIVAAGFVKDETYFKEMYIGDIEEKWGINLSALSSDGKSTKRFAFVWFTDGIGWKSARGNLRETFEVMDMIFNISDMENGVMEKIFV